MFVLYESNIHFTAMKYNLLHSVKFWASAKCHMIKS